MIQRIHHPFFGYSRESVNLNFVEAKIGTRMKVYVPFNIIIHKQRDPQLLRKVFDFNERVLMFSTMSCKISLYHVKLVEQQ